MNELKGLNGWDLALKGPDGEPIVDGFFSVDRTVAPTLPVSEPGVPHLVSDFSGELSCARCGKDGRPLVSIAEYGGYFCRECLFGAAMALPADSEDRE